MRRVVPAMTLCLTVALHGAFTLLTRTSATASHPGDKSDGMLFSENFDDAHLPKRGWYDGDRFTVSDKQPHAGKGCLEYRWEAGTSKPDNSSGVRRLFTPTDTVYLRFYLKLSKGWAWTARPYHPHLMHFMTTGNGKFHGPAASHLTVYIEPWNGKLRLGAQDIQNKGRPHGLTQGPLKGSFNGRTYDSKEELFKDDAWHCVEALFRLNTLDIKADRPNADGVVRGWFDGKLVIDHTDVILRSTDFPKMQFNQVLLTPYFGPGLLPQAQTLWIDELVVGTKRPDPAKAGAGTSGEEGPPPAGCGDAEKDRADREKQLDALLTDILARCQKMLDTQTAIIKGTKTLAAAIVGAHGKKPLPEDRRATLKLAAQAKELVAEANGAIKQIEAEGSAVAFAEVFHEVRDDMKRVQTRLEAGDVGPETQAIQADVMDTLAEMIKALKKG
jgi:hypothetical protein